MTTSENSRTSSFQKVCLIIPCDPEFMYEQISLQATLMAKKNNIYWFTEGIRFEHHPQTPVHFLILLPIDSFMFLKEQWLHVTEFPTALKQL